MEVLETGSSRVVHSSLASTYSMMNALMSLRVSQGSMMIGCPYRVASHMGTPDRVTTMSMPATARGVILGMKNAADRNHVLKNATQQPNVSVVVYTNRSTRGVPACQATADDVVASAMMPAPATTSGDAATTSGDMAVNSSPALVDGAASSVAPISPDDPVVSVLFTLATVSLTVVTLGVGVCCTMCIK